MRRLTGGGITNDAIEQTVFTLTPPPQRLWWLKDGHFGWDAPTPPVDVTSGRIRFTFEDGSTHTTPAVTTPWCARVIGPLSGDGSLSSRITRIEGLLAADGETNTNLVGNFVVEEVVAPPPLEPAPGPRFWFKADSGITLSGSDVTAWADQTSNHFDVAESGVPGHVLPVINVSSVNGLPGVTFTAGLNSGGLEYTGANLYAQGDPRTVFAVVKPGGTSTFGIKGGTVFTFRLSTRVFGLYMATISGTQYGYTDGVAVNVPFTAAVDYSHTPILVRWQFDGTDIHIYVNGVLRSQVSSAVGLENGASPGFMIGNLIHDDGGQEWEGDINEILGYDGAVSAGSALQTETYLRSRWGL